MFFKRKMSDEERNQFDLLNSKISELEETNKIIMQLLHDEKSEINNLKEFVQQIIQDCKTELQNTIDDNEEKIKKEFEGTAKKTLQKIFDKSNELDSRLSNIEETAKILIATNVIKEINK